MWLVPLCLLVLLLGSFFLYTAQYYHAGEAAKAAMIPDAAVQVQKTEMGWLFDGPSKEHALIFYPGAKVEETAYAPLLHDLAGKGMDVFLVSMPFRLAFFRMNGAGALMDSYEYDHWYIGGHSLGGAMAAVYAARHPENLTGVVLLAAYPTKQLDEGLQAVTVYGSEDRVLNRKKLEQGRPFLPEKAVWLEIPGGNHAQFGDYGAQKGDGTASISAQEQLRQTEDVILNMMNEASGT